MRILLLGAHPNAQGPIGRVAGLMTMGLEQLGCDVELIPWGQRRPNEALWRKSLERSGDATRIVQMISRRAFDATLLNTSHDLRALIRDIPLILAARRSGLPVFVLYHGTYVSRDFEGSSGLRRFLFGWRLNNAAGVFTLAREEERAINNRWPYCNVGTTRLPVLPPQVKDRGQRDPEKEYCPTLVFVGRLLEAKGCIDAIRAMPSVLARADCRLEVLGSGPMMQGATRLIEEMALEDHVAMMGQVDQDAVWESLFRAQIFVLPTHYYEGFPVAVLEAICAALPIVTTKAGGLPDWLTQDLNALFVPPGDIQALSDAIVRLLRDRGLMHGMSIANHELAREFEPVPVMGEYLDHMRDWLARGKRSLDRKTK